MKKNSEEYMIGRRFGRLVVKKRGTDRYKPCGERCDMWICVCECGVEKEVYGKAMRENRIKSCGCINKECAWNRKHGQSYTRLHSIWCGMNGRCNNKNSTRYNDWGGRGIKVCKEWEKFEKFYEWSMDNGYADELTIDRIDVNGNYCLENCRWATYKEQGNNKSNNRYITYNGETHTIAEWAEIIGLPYGTLYQRLNKSGWPIEKALTEKVRRW